MTAPPPPAEPEVRPLETDEGLDVEALYARYGPMVLRRCRQLLGDDDLALDAMQDVFTQLVRKRTQLNARAPSSLLYRMATNRCLNTIRSRGRRREASDGHDLLTQISVIDDLEGRSAAGRLLDRIFQRERPSTRVIATLHLVDGYTLEEVAAEVGLSVSGVRKRLRTLKARAKEQIAQ